MSSDPNDYQALTAGHFLTMEPLVSIPTPVTSNHIPTRFASEMVTSPTYSAAFLESMAKRVSTYFANQIKVAKARKEPDTRRFGYIKGSYTSPHLENGTCCRNTSR